MVMEIALLLFLLFIFTKIKKNRDVNHMNKGFFFCAYLIFPLLSGSMAQIFTQFITVFIVDPSVSNFFISLFGLVGLLLVLGLVYFTAIISGSSPLPDLSNPISSWASNTLSFALFELLIIMNLVFMEATRKAEYLAHGIAILAYDFIIVLPILIFIGRQVFCVAYWGHEVAMTQITAQFILSLFFGVISFIDVQYPFYVIIIIWIAVPIICFIGFRLSINARLGRFFNDLDECTLQVNQMTSDDMPLVKEGLEDHPYNSIRVKNGRDAADLLRAACIFNSQSFLDLSLLKWAIEKYPESSFEFLQLAFLIPNEEDLFNRTYQVYHQNNSKNFIHTMVIFQMVMSIQESSNELTQSIVREVSRQKLSALKCQQIVQKFWTSCYKGDISQMSRMALNLQINIEQINQKWKQLLSRYPRSKPILKEYLQFLNGVGCQHGLADSIVKAMPSLAEPKDNAAEDDANLGSLQHSIEDSVEKRPITTISRLRCTLSTMIFLAIMFLCVSFAIAIAFSSQFDSRHAFLLDISSLLATLSNVGNYAYDMRANPDSRSELFDLSVRAEKYLDDAFDEATDTQFALFSDNQNVMLFNITDWNADYNVSLEETLRLLSYFAHTLSFVPADDEIYDLFTSNILIGLNGISDCAKTSIEANTKTTNMILKLRAAFHCIVWGILIIVMIPLLYVAISKVKQEMTYLFAFYINIPHSMLAKFSEGIVGVSACKSTDKKSQLMKLSASFVQSKNETADEQDPMNEANIVGNFKLIVGDSAAHASVLPKNFVAKTSAVIAFACGIVAVLASVSFEMFVLFIQDYTLCLWTERAAALRIAYSSILMNIACNKGEGFTTEHINKDFELATQYHTALLFSDSSLQISPKATSDEKQSSLVHDIRCEDQTKVECRSLSQIFDAYTSSLTTVFNKIENHENVSDQMVEDILRLYLDDLSPLLFESYSLFLEFGQNQITQCRNTQIIILCAAIVALVLILIIFLRPVIIEINQTLHSVKLPMKMIHPFDLAEVPKIVQYLQGECDWRGNRGTGDKYTEKAVTDLVLNVMRSPLGVFGSDLSLVLANDEFYSLLNTSREACVGLPMGEIFSSVIPFERNENHPFNNLLQTVSQLQRGISPVNFIEINCDLEIQGKGKQPILMRLVGISETQEVTDTETLRADHFAIFINDLKPRKILEEKLKFESDMAQRLMDASMPRVLAAVLHENEEQVSRTFENIPMVMLSLRTEHIEDETDDLILRMYSIIMKTAHETNQMFAAMCRLLYQPPYWVFGAGMAVGANDLNFCISETCLFAITLLDKFLENEHETYNITITMHFGTLISLFIPLELPIAELIGDGYEKLKIACAVSQPGMVLGTKEMYEIAKDINGINAEPMGDMRDGEGHVMPLYQFTKSEEVIVES